jgi:tryptophan synthase alpha chain
VYKYGIDDFAKDAGDAGASAVIVPDIALEESDALAAAFHAHGIDMPLLVAPSTDAKRAERIAAKCTGFVYLVSRLGVTGAATGPGEHLRSQIGMLRGITHLPLAVGFGISTPDHVRAVAQLADGFIVGSAIIDAYAGFSGAEAAKRVTEAVLPLIAAANYAVV